MPTPPTSSSAIDTDTTGIVSGPSPAFLYSLKNATLESGSSVLNTASAPADLTLLTMVEKSVAGARNSSPRTSMPWASA